MRLLFAAGDVGGARALLPVARLAAARGYRVAGLAHGVLLAEGEPDWSWMSPAAAAAEAGRADLLIYATSVADRAAVRLAGAARAAGRPCLHVLDNWSSYTQRIAALVPDAYAVMDDLARHEALEAGVPEGILHVTGHPNLAGLADESDRLGPSTDERSLLFVSEPASRDDGARVRGYDEVVVMQALVAGLSRLLPAQATLRVAPHPREDREAVASRLARLCRGIDGAPAWSLVPKDGVRAALHAATHVVGMSSILLYEAWLLGRATLSLQPGLNCPGLGALSRREGLMCHHAQHGIDRAMATWLARAPGAPQPETDRHRQAAAAVLQLAGGLVAAAGQASINRPRSSGRHA